MNKKELIDAVSSHADLSKADAGRAVDAVTNTITSELAKGGDVRLIGFGTFSVSKRNARTGRNPRTGKEIKIAAKKVAKFKAGASLATSVN